MTVYSQMSKKRGVGIRSKVMESRVVPQLEETMKPDVEVAFNINVLLVTWAGGGLNG